MKINSGYIYLFFFILGEAFFPIFTYFAVKNLPTLYIIAFSTLISFLFGLLIFIYKKLYLQYFDKKILKPAILSAVFMGIGGMLYFFGIEYSSASTAATLLLLQSFFAFIVFNLFGKEDYNHKQIIGAIFMFVGGVIILYDGQDFINLGAFIMIVAGIVWTLGNFFTKKASLVGASPFFLLINRNILMTITTFILAYIFVGSPNVELVKQNFIWIFLIGFFVLFLAKTFWILALSKLNSFVAISSFPFIPLLVLILSFFILGEVPDIQKILGFIPIFVGSFLLVRK